MNYRLQKIPWGRSENLSLATLSFMLQCEHTVSQQTSVEASLYTILQSLSLTLFEKMLLDQLLTKTSLHNLDSETSTQLNLFD
jgi:hypothetical protein